MFASVMRRLAHPGVLPPRWSLRMAIGGGWISSLLGGGRLRLGRGWPTTRCCSGSR